MNKIVVLLSCFIALNVNLFAQVADKAILEAEVELLPVNPNLNAIPTILSGNPNDKNTPIINPGSGIRIFARLKNSGTKSNQKGYFYIRFVYPTPLAGRPNSELFVTEKVMLPSIGAGKEASITFNTPQISPSLFDFIRDDFGMRQYQAVVVIDNKEYVIGSSALTFSAYYYSTPAEVMPLEVPGI
jgi:hypothetical protein